MKNSPNPTYPTSITSYRRKQRETDMQPPQMNGYLRRSVTALLQEVESNNVAVAAIRKTAERSEQNRATTQTDYVALIRNWYAAIPPAARQRRYTTAEMALQFNGRYRARPSVRMIAAALREIGFTEHRDWTKAGRNCRYWQPPSKDFI